MYIAMQLLGGFSGGLLAWALGNSPAGDIYPDVVETKEDYQVFGAEFMFTFLLVTLVFVLVTLTNPGNGIPNTISGIHVGWMVMAAIGAIGTIDAVSGCCLNPAVWFGTIMSAACSVNDLSTINFQYVWVYVISELLAGAAAGLLFRYLWKDDERRETNISKYVAEFLGTFFLVSFIKLSLANPDIITYVRHGEVFSFVNPVLSIGFGLCILIYTFGCISGAHFNPAVSLGVYCRGYVDGFYPGQYMNLVFYIIAQLLGGMFGGMYSWGIDGKKACDVYVHVTDESFEKKTEAAFGAEYMFTFLLVSSVIHAGVGQQPNDFYGMTIGFTVFAAVQLIGPISGACLNPAVWFGTIISAQMCDSSSLKWEEMWIYLLATLLGGITAGFVYKFLYYEPDAPLAINEPTLQAGGIVNSQQVWAQGSSPKSERL